MHNHFLTTRQITDLMKKAYLDGWDDRHKAPTGTTSVNPLASSEVAWAESVILSNFNDDLKEGKLIC